MSVIEECVKILKIGNNVKDNKNNSVIIIDENFVLVLVLIFVVDFI